MQAEDALVGMYVKIVDSRAHHYGDGKQRPWIVEEIDSAVARIRDIELGTWVFVPIQWLEPEPLMNMKRAVNDLLRNDDAPDRETIEIAKLLREREQKVQLERERELEREKAEKGVLLDNFNKQLDENKRLLAVLADRNRLISTLRVALERAQDSDILRVLTAQRHAGAMLLTAEEVAAIAKMREGFKKLEFDLSRIPDMSSDDKTELLGKLKRLGFSG